MISLPNDWSAFSQGDLDRMPLSDLRLPVRTQNHLDYAGIKSVGDLIRKSPDDLLAIYGFGRTGLKIVRQKLADRGLRLRGDTWTPWYVREPLRRGRPRFFLPLPTGRIVQEGARVPIIQRIADRRAHSCAKASKRNCVVEGLDLLCSLTIDCRLVDALHQQTAKRCDLI